MPPSIETAELTPVVFDARACRWRRARSLVSRLLSRELALFLLAVVLSATFAGTIVPQRTLTPPADFELWRRDHSGIAMIAEAVGLTNVYAVWWFLAALGLLVVSLGLCSANRAIFLWRTTRRGAQHLSFDEMSRLEHYVEIAPPGTAEAVTHSTTAALRKSGYSCRVSSEESGWRAIASKNSIGAWGSVVLHFGLLVVLLGGFYSGATKAAGYFELVEGQSFVESHDGYDRLNEAPLFGERHEGFRVRLDRLQTEFWPNGSLRDIRSDVSVIDGDKGPEQASTWVNGALVHRGVTIYQSRRNGFAAVLAIADAAGRPFGEGTVNFPTPAPGDRPAFQTFRLPQTEWQVLADFYPNWGEPTSPEDWQMPQPPRPALFLTVRDDLSTVYSGMLALGDSVTIGHVVLSYPETRRWAGFPVLHDSGIGVVFAGFALCVAGSALSCLLVPRRLWLATVRDAQGRLTLLIGGHSAKYQPAFGEELAFLVDRIVDEVEEEQCSTPRAFCTGLQ